MAETPTSTNTPTTDSSGGPSEGRQAPPPPTGPPLPPPPARPWTPPPPLPASWLPATIGVGIVAAAVVGRVPMASFGTATLILVLAAALHLTGSVRSRSGRWCLIGAAGFGLLLMLRTDPRLVAFNALAAALLIGVAVIGPKRIFDWRPLELLNDAVSIAWQPFVMLGDLFPGPEGARSEPVDRSARRQLIVGVLQGAAIAVPLLIIIAALLGSADVVFADLLSRGQFDVGALSSAALRFSVGAVLAIVLIGRTVRERSVVPPAGVELGRMPTLIVLGALNAMFALFVVAQLYALTSAGEQILIDAGLTYREYARQGFFQLLWVSGLTLVVLLSLRSAASQWFVGDRWFRASSLATVVLTFGVVVVAFGRLHLYIADDGLTPLRFYSSVFCVWVAMGFVIVALRLLGVRTSDAWTLPALVVSGLAVLVVLNAANPEARIADNLVALDRPAIVLHMQKLTEDGQLVMANGLDQLDTELAEEVGAILCRDVPDDDGVLAWNLGRSRARSALLELC